MARRRAPEPVEDDSPDAANTVPAHLLGRHYPTTPEEVAFWVPAVEKPPPDYPFPEPFWRQYQASVRKRTEAEAWCAVRGYSYAQTFLGWHQPTSKEVADGHVGLPPAGPVNERRRRTAA